MIKRYEFPSVESCDKAADHIYKALSDMRYRTTFENLEGHAHQIYRIFSKTAQTYHPGDEIMRFELNCVVEPPCLRVDLGTSRHKITFSEIVGEALESFHGKEVSEKIK